MFDFLGDLGLLCCIYREFNTLFFIILDIIFMRMGERKVLVGKPEGKRPHGKPRRRWEDNIKMTVQKVRCGEYGLDRADSG
jgi:hypothetical protein